MEENSDSEYEEAVVLVELNGIIDSNFLLQEPIPTPTKILGIETERPILQLGHYIFSGEYEDTLGTVIAYEPTTTVNREGKEIDDYKFVCKTDKKLSMQRIFLQDKEATKADESKEVTDVTDKFRTPDSKEDTEEGVSPSMDCSDSVSDADANKQ